MKERNDVIVKYTKKRNTKNSIKQKKIGLL